jgi:hypothetical protein
MLPIAQAGEGFQPALALKFGIMECWNSGVIRLWNFIIPSFHHSIIPVFQHSGGSVFFLLAISYTAA